MALLSTAMHTHSEAADLLGAHENELLTREEAAGVLRVTAETLRNWEKDNKGPPSVKVGSRTVLYSKQGIIDYLEECRVTSQVVSASRPLTPAQQEAQEQAIATERRRCIAIMNRAPKGFEDAVTTAINNKTSIEDFDASLPSEWRAILPPLHKFLAELDCPRDYASEAAGRAIIASFSLTSRGSSK